ncbi:MAG: hypothetical protein HYR55_12120 [Acidobacteria bacterium]|nr:hypothetical protein [Acidobacteriota bacterium]MBI3655465.1 hypothetical protein [Acidobacteriota bacterium]
MFKIAFLPGNLALEKDTQNVPQDGLYHLVFKGEEIGSFKSETQAVKKYNEIRQKLETEFPKSDYDDVDKKRLLMEALKDSLVSQNSYRPRNVKKNKTRTFG